MDLFELRTAVDLLRGTEQESDRRLRLTRLGELAGTIMHEVNQPLGAIISSADAALRWLDRDTPDVAAATRSIRRIRAVASRSGRTIVDLQSLSSNILIDFAERPLNSVVDEALQISKPPINQADVRMQVCLDRNSPIAKINKDLMLRVMLNLIQNAIDSLLGVPDRQRTLNIRTFTSSEIVVAEFEDNGVGLPEGPAAHLFDPLYTTKKGGMGLGLALCRRVVIAHGGSIDARSNPSYGATFAVSLPRVGP
ncbi:MULTISPECIES: sensor histidine kinase [unclassified Bradyrhizobium]|uniref:sensor histidine kinase n=1 Tax=unclassified Bradyrhizobium TaxID=2631580 RepID=UPI0020B37E6C|nr:MULTISPECIES: ATP-binding protein [unclassified Bradyrhizobium]MCP3402756.1 ATP-binding protein [Bradyrhizobium sp. CCGB20]MCP3411236.1 ATP-binding protein [Bradyrhizobium sp. CCGB01]